MNYFCYMIIVVIRTDKIIIKFMKCPINLFFSKSWKIIIKLILWKINIIIKGVILMTSIRIMSISLQIAGKKIILVEIYTY